MQLEEKLKRAGEISLTAYGAMQKTKETAYTWCSYLNQFSTPNRFFPGSDSSFSGASQAKGEFCKSLCIVEVRGGIRPKDSFSNL